MVEHKMGKLKILITVPDFGIIGGKANYYKALKPHFKHNAEYFTYGPRVEIAENNKLLFFKRLLVDYIHFFRKLRTGKHEVVIINPSLSFNGILRDSIFLIIALLLRRKAIVFYRGWSKHFEQNIELHYLLYMKCTLFLSDASIVLANEFKQKLREWGNRKPIHIETTVVDSYLSEGISKKDIQNRLEKSNAYLLFLSRVEKSKGIYETINSFNYIKRYYPELNLIVAGTGKEFDKILIISDTSSRIKSIGFVQGKEKASVFKNASLYLFPSYHGEGMPNSVVEAMASGLPVITTLTGGLADFFIEDKMGYVLDNMETDTISKIICKLLDSKDDMERISFYNFDYARLNFYSKIVCERLERIINNTLLGIDKELSWLNYEN